MTRTLRSLGTRSFVTLSLVVALATGTTAGAAGSDARDPGSNAVYSGCLVSGKLVKVLAKDRNPNRCDGLTSKSGVPGRYVTWNAAGVTGPQGEPGLQGNQGVPGPTGEQGIQGVPGPTGEQGIQGELGPQGEVGPAGATGVAGPTGQQGEVGPSGATGVAGPTGPRGEQGFPGDPGPQGATGAQGPAGPAGENAGLYVTLDAVGSTTVAESGPFTLTMSCADKGGGQWETSLAFSLAAGESGYVKGNTGYVLATGPGGGWVLTISHTAAFVADGVSIAALGLDGSTLLLTDGMMWVHAGAKCGMTGVLVTGP